jgi:hypothetical protein
MQNSGGLVNTRVADATITYLTLKPSSRDREIIAVYKRGDSLLTIANRFGVTCADVQRIVVRVGDLGRVLANPTAREKHVGGP